MKIFSLEETHTVDLYIVKWAVNEQLAIIH